MAVEVGGKIKALRILRGLTQKELGDRCELSKGFISQLESDQAAPSLETLNDILEVLGISMSDFFASDSNEAVVYKADDMFETESENGSVTTWLVKNAQVHSMEPILMTIPSGEQTPHDKPHTGEEFGYVLAGSVYLYLGIRKYKIKKGDSFYFKADREHYLVNTGKSQATVLWVSTPPNF